jgi:hypothetical protein
MCDYSLELVASRPAKVGDKLVLRKRISRTFSRRGACPSRKMARDWW